MLELCLAWASYSSILYPNLPKMSLIKIFTSWRKRKPRRVDDIISSNGAAASGGRSGSDSMHTSAHLQQRFLHEVAPHDHRLYCGGGFSGTQPVDEGQQPASVLPQPLNGNYDIQSLQDMMCPIYSSSLLHHNKPLRRTSDASTDGSAKDCDMDLLIYQYALQNAILSVGTLGGELLCQLAAEMDNENFICIGAPFADNNLLEVRKHVKYCAQTSAPQNHALVDAADECSLLKNEIGKKGPTASKASCSTNHAVLLNTDNLIDRISSIDASDEVQVKMQRKYCAGDTGQEIKCAIPTIYSTSISNTILQGEHKTQQDIVRAPAYMSANYRNPIDNHSIEDEMGNNQNFLKLMRKELDDDPDLVNGDGMKGNGEEAFLASSSVYQIQGFSQYPQGIIDCCKSYERVMGNSISPSNAQWVLDSSKHTQVAMGNSLGSIMGTARVSAQGMMGSSFLNASAQGTMGLSKSAQGMMDCSACSAANEGMMEFSKNAEGIQGFDKASSCSIADTKPEDYLRKDEEELDSENVATPTNFQKLVCMSCSHPMDLKRLILAVTPNYVAKYLFKCLKLGHGQLQLGGQNCNQHYKFYKLLRMLRINQSRRASTTMKRELGPLAVDHDDHVQGCNNDEEETSVKYSLQGNSTNVAGISSRAIASANNTSTNTTTATSMGMILTSNVENWISTDDEYVVLELEGNQQ